MHSLSSVLKDKILAKWLRRVCGLLMAAQFDVEQAAEGGYRGDINEVVRPHNRILRRMIRCMAREYAEPGYRAPDRPFRRFDDLGRAMLLLVEERGRSMVPFSACVDRGVITSEKQLRAALRNNPGIGRSKPSRLRLQVHAGDLTRHKQRLYLEREKVKEQVEEGDDYAQEAARAHEAARIKAENLRKMQAQ
jgi:hypothetical protein